MIKIIEVYRMDSGSGSGSGSNTLGRDSTLKYCTPIEENKNDIICCNTPKYNLVVCNMLGYFVGIN